MADLLSDENVEKSLRGLDDWNYNDVYRQIHKDFTLNIYDMYTIYIIYVPTCMYIVRVHSTST